MDLGIWRGPQYERASLKLLVLGESRYDEDFPDRKIIEWRVAGQFEGGQRRTFTNFERAVLPQGYSETDAQAFWNRTAFYNYVRTFFPGRPRLRMKYALRVDTKNANSFRKVLQELKPTHVIVWGLGNWDSIDAGAPWAPDQFIPGSQEPFCSTTIGEHAMLFTRIRHPSAAFSSLYWAPVLSQFLQLR